MTNHTLETRLGQQSPSHEPYSSGAAPYDRHGLGNSRGTGAARTADEPPNARRGELLRVGDGAFVFMVPAVLLSGFATPIENTPEWLQTLTLANPFAVLRGDHQGGVFKGNARGDRGATALAVGGDRARHALGGNMAVPASG